MLQHRGRAALKALAKAPSDRYGSATALAGDLQRYLNGQPVQARPNRFSYRFRKLIQRRPTECAAAVAAVLAKQLHPDYGGVNNLIGKARLYLGQLPEALDIMENEPQEDLRLAGLATVYTAMGKRTESDVALRKLESGFAADDAYAIAQVHAYRGEADSAFEWLQRSYQMHDSNILSIKTDPLLRNLHADRRFQALLVKLRLPE